eukprot:gene4376-8716_t
MSVILTDTYGSFGYKVMSSLDTNSWIINSPYDISSVLLVFSSINIQSAQIQIYDSSVGPSGIPLFSCTTCGSLLPPPITSKSGSVVVFIGGVQGTSFTQSTFQLQYICKFNKLIPEVLSIASYVLNLNMPFAKIEPILVNGVLPANLKTTWTINIPNVNQIIISISNFNFGNICSARLSIYNGLSDTLGSLLYSGCTQSDRLSSSWLYATSGQALVVLQAGTRHQNISFAVTYTSDADMYRCGSLVQPNLFQDDSMVFTDGSKSTSEMRRTESCSWLIAPAAGGPVTLLMKWVSLKYGSSVIVYDGVSAASGRLLWNGVGPTTTTPPPLTSTRGYLFIVYNSNNFLSTGFLGFRGEYFRQGQGSSSLGMGSRVNYLTMSSAISISPAWSLSSSPLPQSLSNVSVMAYTWVISPNSVTAQATITIAFTSLNLLGNGDRLTMSDGIQSQSQSMSPSPAVLFQQSGPINRVPNHWLRTTSSSATISLITSFYRSSSSSSSSTMSYGSGFDISFYSDGMNYNCGIPSNTLGNFTAPFLLFTDGSSSRQTMYPSQNCVWRLLSPGSKGVVLTFDRFDLRGGSLSFYFNRISFNSLWFSIADTTAIPAPIQLLSEYPLYVVFQTKAASVVPGAVVFGYGFRASYFAITPTSNQPGNGVINLKCSSALSVTLPPLYSNISQYDISTNLTWIISPVNVTLPIYLSFVYVNLPNCNLQYLLITDGSNNNNNNIKLCGDSSRNITKSWLQSTSSYFKLDFVSLGADHPLTPVDSLGFDLSYYSDGPNHNCGIHRNPALVRAPSMIITDGSASSSSMYSNQLCEWLIKPSLDGDKSVGRDEANQLVVLEVLLSDLIGASLNIYDGTSDTGVLIWKCTGCNTVPALLVAHTGNVFVRFRSRDLPNTALGKGFRMSYWTKIIPSTSPFYVPSVSQESPKNVLELPVDFRFAYIPTTQSDFMDRSSFPGENMTGVNISHAYILTTTAQTQSMNFHPYISAPQDTKDIATGRSGISTYDGRPQTSTLYPTGISTANDAPMKRLSCGIATGVSFFANQQMKIGSTQRANTYLLSSRNDKILLNFASSWNRSTLSSSSQSKAVLSPASICHYELRSSSGNGRAIRIHIKKFTGSLGGSLYVYGGRDGKTGLLLSAELSDVSDQWLQAPCGLSTVVLQYNNGSSRYGSEGGGGGASMSGGVVGYTLEMDYVEDITDNGGICAIYMLGVYIYYSQRRTDVPKRYTPTRYREAPVSSHPKYTPIMDNARNKLLFRGLCCICKETAHQVLRLKCKHTLCIDDMQSYLQAGLQDISKFPMKCPMHYEGCEERITPYTAKRFLSAANYTRFLDFMDRSTLGEGIRCIFCANFVNLPTETKMLMVECPHCVRRFCMRCRRPWHYKATCPLEAQDDLELQNWKAGSGAQKCPACSKLIEKEDPDTCNHMIHKITDSIPCIRNRTDFCCEYIVNNLAVRTHLNLCGVEVTPDYPHEEASRPGVNHFPRGVFQCCLTVIDEERREEEETSSKKRMTTARSPKRTNRRPINNPVAPVFRAEEVVPVSFSAPTSARTQPLPTTGQIYARDDDDPLLTRRSLHVQTLSDSDDEDKKSVHLPETRTTKPTKTKRERAASASVRGASRSVASERSSKSPQRTNAGKNPSTPVRPSLATKRMNTSPMLRTTASPSLRPARIATELR